jgi:UDP-2-acetamido-3-amino-2,3-dideoxy-glucuronate N-acetyltransferase
MSDKPSWLKGSIADVHPSVSIGDNSFVWSFSVICPDVTIGENSVIGSGVYVGRGCKIGNNVRIQDKAHVTDRMVIEDNVFIGPCAVTMNDKYPVSNNPNYQCCPPFFGDGCSIGAGAVILPGVRIGRNSIVGAGALVTKDVPDNTVVMGVPASIKRTL